MWWWAAAATAATVHISPGDDLWGAVAALEPGDTLEIHEGTYSTFTGSWYRSVSLAGTADAPIVIRAAPGESVLLQADPAGSQNGLDLSGTYWTLEGIRLQYGSHGLRLGTSRHGSVVNVEIFDTRDVGLSMNRPGETYAQMTVRGCEIHHTAGTGEGMYLGCNDGGCVVQESVIEGNWVHDTVDSEQGDGIELKAGSWGNALRDNVIANTRYPGLTLYGTYGQPANTASGNVVLGTLDNGIQVVGEVWVHDNLVFDAAASGIYAKSSQGSVPTALTIAHNTVANAGLACLKLDNLDQGGTDIVVANNLLVCPGSEAIRLGAGQGAALVAANAVDGSSAVPGQPSAVGALPGGWIGWPTFGVLGEAAYQTPSDVDCRPRTAPYAGAYAWTPEGGPAWTVASAFKPCAPPPEPAGDTGAARDTGAPAADPPSDDDPAGAPSPAADAAGCGCQHPRGSSGWSGVVVAWALARRRSAQPA